MLEEVIVEVALVLDHVEDSFLRTAFGFLRPAESDHGIGDFVVLIEEIPERQHQTTEEPEHEDEATEAGSCHREREVQIGLRDSLEL